MAQGSKAKAAAARPAPKTVAVARRLTLRPTSPQLAKRCSATARSGERCKSAPLHGTKLCALHTGDTASRLGAIGGRRRAIFNPENLEPFSAPKDAGDLLRLLATTICEVRAAKIDTRAASAIGYLSSGFLKAYETADIAARLAALESRVQAKQDAWGTAKQ
jgi:hypothetical protein